MKIKILDIPIIVLGLVFTLLVAISIYSGETVTSQVTIRALDKTWIFPLDAEETLTVNGFIGETKVLIHGGRAAIVSSCCTGQTCVASGDLHKNGQWAACLPNGVFLVVEGSNEETVDAASW